ncbi:HDIG domain-containing protein [Desulfuromonas versatilis]|uniref:HDIG domain-containing protein n=1 Tax=Desulfuromonas versatilis TaxID=2802975 RepID=A0ABN6DZV8_9BACT|nr:HD domain-containing phosphohydrolase [Desulfuromonas versatilis]BCR05437.1 HDIG domain-containing protein [Desulfuromonas versatilis]
MNSLKIKILSITTIIMVMAVGLTAWHNLRTQQAMLAQIAIQNGRILGETIRNSIITDMANGENAAVGHILEKIKREPTIAAVRVFDDSGRVLISAAPEEIGDIVDAADLLAFRSGKTSYSIEKHGSSFHNTNLPIYNAPACYSCHGPEKEILGVLSVHLSLNALDSLQSAGREATFLSSVGMLIILILAISGFILFYVDSPIRKLVAAMTHLERGEFDRAEIKLTSSREMTQLSGKFNSMVERLKDLIQATVRHERELAISQEKLAHHDEIRNMNITLAERLKEIEYLNISLEERIEEIEEANYKIADLASDLENKNTNLERAVTRLSAIYKLGLAINSTMDLNQLFHLLVNRTVNTLKARVGYLLLLEKDTWSAKLAGATGLPPGVDPDMRLELKPGGVAYWAIRNCQPLLISSMNEAREFSRISRLGYTRETVICAPLLIKDEPIGAITIANKADNTAFSLDDLELLGTIAAQASIAIKNARLYEEQQQTYLNTVQALVSAIEASDAYTRGHSERVKRYSVALARRINLAPTTIKRLEQAAILHDIGKIGIDVALLNKRETLSLEDVDMLRQHPAIGGRILEPIQFLREVREIIEQHHERFDGGGYPHRLTGENISIEARILAVADTYDAMTSDRPYRKALSHQFALQEIASQAGSQFDPQVANAFLGMCQEEGFQPGLARTP